MLGNNNDIDVIVFVTFTIVVHSFRLSLTGIVDLDGNCACSHRSEKEI